MMLITRTSIISGQQRSFLMPITADQWDAYQNGELIQHALCDLTPEEREYVMTGITKEEWDARFGECDAFPGEDYELEDDTEAEVRQLSAFLPALGFK